jgi:hypothetical protein
MALEASDLEKILSLLRLGEDPRTPAHEASAALRVAEKRMRGLGLRSSDVRRQGSRLKAQSSELSEDVVIVDPLYVVTEYGHAYRMAKLTPPLRVSNRFVLLPKSYVRAVTFLSPDEVEAMGWTRSQRITKAVVLDRAYLREAVSHGWHSWC